MGRFALIVSIKRIQINTKRTPSLVFSSDFISWERGAFTVTILIITLQNTLNEISTVNLKLVTIHLEIHFKSFYLNLDYFNEQTFAWPVYFIEVVHYIKLKFYCSNTRLICLKNLLTYLCGHKNPIIGFRPVLKLLSRRLCFARASSSWSH